MHKIFIEINIDNFEEEYNSKYLKILNNSLVLKLLKLDPYTPIKKNGTWLRNLIVMRYSTLEEFLIKIQKFDWIDSNGEHHYASIFPSFIFKYNPLHADLIEHVASNLNEDKSVFDIVDDNKSIVESEDIIMKSCSLVQEKLSKLNILEKLVSTYVEKYNESISSILSKITLNYKFYKLYCIILISSCLYKIKSRILSHLNSLI
jgi:hypothetical protein